MTATPAVTPAARTKPDAAPAGLLPAPVTVGRATLRSLIVCVPEGVAAQELLDGFATSHGVTVTAASWLWSQPTLWFWQRQALIGAQRPRRHGPHLCAGGPVRWLDLAGLRQAAAVHAGLRHTIWSQVVTSTKPARPWHEFETQHRADPVRMPPAEVRARFLRQARISAMRIHNAAQPGMVCLDPYDVEQFQAGPSAYRNFHSLKAVCADGMITADGRWLLPDSDAFTDRITYLHQAWRTLTSHPRTGTLLAANLH
jgi:hypothetical protein